MAIHGVGVDLVDIERMRRVINGKLGRRFLTRVFTPYERDYAADRARPWESLAARFACKEAVMKALGRPGWGFPWPEIEIRRRDDGTPGIRLYGRTAAHAQAAGIERIHVSLSHDDDKAVAQAVAETG